jgi:hypothetical protein
MCGRSDQRVGQAGRAFLPRETGRCVGKYSQEPSVGLQVAGGAAVGCNVPMAKFEEGQNCLRHSSEPSQSQGSLFATTGYVYFVLLPGSWMSAVNI